LGAVHIRSVDQRLQSGTELFGRGHGSKVRIFGYFADPRTSINAGAF
jgi:hypothetical protein